MVQHLIPYSQKKITILDRVLNNTKIFQKPQIQNDVDTKWQTNDS